ncbi:hypothetical protein EB354_00230 [Chryseobacterium balustinum]|uniref:Uncharacterized protein n=2 Tax=Chryseobacterium balustinum TaxID=246 RepID=A0AAX2IG13_9FLAO|nr:hypothetical protein EB354_00230 [Chryseobacterium balustinum]SKC01009.1 hypothetical protein SAMN05421800_12025 [Chryseobacterium balustinum]SQA86734.1 Uncharacterised protein [Chryseobacterium balustinum]
MFLLFSFIIISCQKKEIRTKVIKNTGDIEEMFRLKNYKQEVKLMINDSINRITATNGHFILTGDFNTKTNTRTGIWSLKNKVDSKEIQIDYIVLGKNNVFENQIIFKEHGKIDSSNSKFYLVENKTLQGLSYKFFSPEMKNEISKEAKVIYTIYRNRKEIKIDSVVYKNVKEGKYFADVKYDFKKGDHISGYFSEIVTARDPRIKDSLLLGNNSIYFIEKFE